MNYGKTIFQNRHIYPNGSFIIQLLKLQNKFLQMAFNWLIIQVNISIGVSSQSYVWFNIQFRVFLKI